MENGSAAGTEARALRNRSLLQPASRENRGAQLEGVHNGTYRIVDRWSPKKGIYRDAALFLLKLANVKVREVY